MAITRWLWEVETLTTGTIADGRCSIDVSLIAPAQEAHASFRDIRTGAWHIIQQCLGDLNKPGGMATKIGESNGHLPCVPPASSLGSIAEIETFQISSNITSDYILLTMPSQAPTQISPSKSKPPTSPPRFSAKMTSPLYASLLHVYTLSAICQLQCHRLKRLHRALFHNAQSHYPTCSTAVSY